VLCIAFFGMTYVIFDLNKKINNSNRYKISFKKEFHSIGVPLIKLKFNGKLEWFLVDTGSNVNYLRKNIYEELEVKPEIIGNDIIKNSTCTTESNVIKINLSFNKTKFNDEKFHIMSIAPFDNGLFKGKYNIIGLIGNEFFEKYKLTIDFDKLIIWIKK